MAAEDEEAREEQEGTGGMARGGVAALVGLGVVAAGVGVALGAKAVLAARRKGTSVARELPVVGEGSGGAGSSEDLPTVLRRAALDVALAATTEAADRLGSSRKP